MTRCANAKCGVEFTGRTDQHYCSRKCKNADFTRRKRKGQRAYTVDRDAVSAALTLLEGSQ